MSLQAQSCAQTPVLDALDLTRVRTLEADAETTIRSAPRRLDTQTWTRNRLARPKVDSRRPQAIPDYRSPFPTPHPPIDRKRRSPAGRMADSSLSFPLSPPDPLLPPSSHKDRFASLLAGSVFPGEIQGEGTARRRPAGTCPPSGRRGNGVCVQSPCLPSRASTAASSDRHLPPEATAQRRRCSL